MKVNLWIKSLNSSNSTQEHYYFLHMYVFQGF